MMEAKKWISSQNAPTVCRPTATAASRGSSQNIPLGASSGISLDTIRSIEWLHANAVLISYESNGGMTQLQIDSDSGSLKWLVEALSTRLIGISLTK
jgi:hypothetical protein